MENRKHKISESTARENLGTINQAENLSGRMLQLFMSGQHSDIVFIVEEQRIPAHRCILAAGNEYFRGLLYGGLPEASQEEIELKVPLEAFKAVLRYIYSGQICLQDLEEDTVLDVLELSNMYGLEALELAIVKYLKRIVTLNNVSAIFNITLHFELEGLKGICHAFMDRNASALLAHESFKKLPKELLQQVLARRSFVAPEFEIFRFVSDFRKANPGVDVSPLLSCVRLPLMSVVELSKVRKSGIVELEALMDAVEERDASEKLPHRVLPGENMAALKYGSKVIQGLWVLDPPPPGDIFPYDFKDTTDSTPAALKNNGREGVVVQLGIISVINRILIRLSGQDDVSYFLEVSENQLQWERVVDYKNFCCRNLQWLYFPPKIVKYIKIIKTRGKDLKIAALKATYTEILRKQVNGFLAATIELCWPGEKGKKADGLFPSYPSSLSTKEQRIQLDQPYFVGLIRLFMWGNKGYFYNPKIRVSADGQNWCFGLYKRDEENDSLNFSFDPRPVAFIEIKDSRPFNPLAHYIHFEALQEATSADVT